jgi:hypothetical protein
MWSYKSCPKCTGDTFIDQDVEGCYIKCLQCGYEREVDRKHTNIKQIVVKGKAGIPQLAYGMK